MWSHEEREESEAPMGSGGSRVGVRIGAGAQGKAQEGPGGTRTVLGFMGALGGPEGPGRSQGSIKVAPGSAGGWRSGRHPRKHEIGEVQGTSEKKVLTRPAWSLGRQCVPIRVG